MMQNSTLLWNSWCTKYLSTLIKPRSIYVLREQVSDWSAKASESLNMSELVRRRAKWYPSWRTSATFSTFWTHPTVHNFRRYIGRHLKEGPALMQTSLMDSSQGGYQRQQKEGASGDGFPTGALPTPHATPHSAHRPHRTRRRSESYLSFQSKFL